MRKKISRLIKKITRSLVVIAASSAVTAMSAAGVSHAATVTDPIEQHYAAQGSYATTSSVVTSNSLTFDLYYPSNYSALGFTSPIITWGDGTGSTPSVYTTLFNHLASWGFTVVAPTTTNAGSGNEMINGAQYLIGQNSTTGSVFKGHLNTGEVAAVGHSQGAAGAVRAATNDTSQVKTVMTFSLPATGWEPAWTGKNYPSCPTAASCAYNTASLNQPIFLISTHGFVDSIIASPATEKAFYNAVPGGAAMGIIQTSDNKAADHSSIENTANGGNPNGELGYSTAWLMYQLRGDTAAKGVFTGTSPEILANSNWPGSAVKNLK